MRRRKRGVIIGVLAAALPLAACVPLFTDGLFQSLRLAFQVDRDLAAGDAARVHTVVFADDVKVKKNFVQVSGRLTAASGHALPTRVTVRADIEDVATGKLAQRITVALAVAEDGTFRARARIRKNVIAGQMMSVMVEPTGAALAAGSEILLCVDLVKKKGALDALPDCVPAEDDGEDPGDGPDPAATFSSLQADFFNPTCSQAGCHSAGSARAGLVLTAEQAYANLVNVPSSQRPQFLRVAPNDPENSYVIRKLRGDAGIEGERMPLGGPFLTDEQLARFVRWIEDGAPNN